MKISARLFALACILLVVFAESAAICRSGKSAELFLRKTITFQGKEIKYAVYVSHTYAPDTPMPAIISLGGGQQSGTDGFKQTKVGLGYAIKRNPNDWPFIVIFPQKENDSDNWIDEDALVMAILEKTRREYNLDPTRLYLTGLSDGGEGTWAIGARHHEIFAAVAPICGEGDVSTAPKFFDLPVWTFISENDPYVSADAVRRMAQAVNAAGGDCRLTIYAGLGHYSWNRAYRKGRLGKWFLQNQNYWVRYGNK